MAEKSLYEDIADAFISELKKQGSIPERLLIPLRKLLDSEDIEREDLAALLTKEAENENP